MIKKFKLVTGALFTCIKKAYNGVKTYYRNLRIKNKLFTILFLTVSIAFLVSFPAIQITFSTYNSMLYNQAAQVLNLSTMNIEAYLKSIEKLSFNIVTSPNIQNFVSNIKNPQSDYDRTYNLNKLTDQLTAYSFTEDNILSINFFDTNGNQNSCGAQPFYIDEALSDEIIQKAVSAQGKAVILGPMGGDNSVMVTRIIRAVPEFTLEYMGTIVIRCNINKLIVNLLSSSHENSPQLVILSENDPIYSSQDLKLNVKEASVFKNTSGYDIKKIKGEEYFVSHNISDYTGWTYLSIIPYQSIFHDVIFIRIMVLITFALIYMLTAVVGIRFACNLTKPLELLTDKMKHVEKGNFEILQEELAEYDRKDEIGQLQNDFLIMIRKIDTLIKDNYIKQLAVKDAQLMSLQAQINPHFLYNTLESINWMAKVNKQDNISKMVEALGFLMRSAISNKNKVITLEEECKLLESYIVIQKIRYEDMLDFKIHLPDELKNLKIPKLTLQPIVENSINYGLENMLDTCKITVDFIPEHKYLDIVIKDNGPGIDPETLKKLNTGDIKPKGLGIGLKNINDRLKLIFSDEYGINVLSGMGEGTTVHVNIPYEMGDRNV